MAYSQNKNPFTSPVRMEEESCELELEEGIFGKKNQCVNKGLNKQRRKQQKKSINNAKKRIRQGGWKWAYYRKET